MNVTRDVIHDLLPAYLAGEVSADTKALVEEFLLGDPDLARTVSSLRANLLPEPPIALRPTQEKETLRMTKRLLRLRGILMGLGIFLTLLPFSQRLENGRITWTFLHNTPAPVTVLVFLAALACWGSYLYVRRRLQGTDL
jgi:anti-sigma factor RsiW